MPTSHHVFPDRALPAYGNRPRYKVNAKIGAPFDAAPFGKPLDGEIGLVWEDLREIHRAIVRFKDAPPKDLRLQYWRTRWPQRRLPRDRIPGGADVGWWELGDWFTGEWQTADADASVEDKAVLFTFRPINEKEFPDLTDFPAPFRATLKVRLLGGAKTQDPESEVEGIEAYTDSIWAPCILTLLWEHPPQTEPSFEAFNGYVESAQRIAPDKHVVTIWRTENPDPNSSERPSSRLTQMKPSPF